MIRLNTGQYRHWQLSAVAPSYLRWFLRHRSPSPRFRRAICAELGRLKIDRTRPDCPAILYE
jgi:hypothetical protein